MVKISVFIRNENNKYCHWPPDTDESEPDDEFLRAMYREKNKN